MIEIVNLTGDYYTYLNLMITECRTLFLQTGRETLFLTHADGIETDEYKTDTECFGRLSLTFERLSRR